MNHGLHICLPHAPRWRIILERVAAVGRLLSFPTSLILLIAVATTCCAQGTFYRTVTFDSVPIIKPGTGRVETNYFENGMVFAPIKPGESFTRAGGGRTAFPENGNAYILNGFGHSLAGSLTGSAQFGLFSVDLSEFSTLYASPWSVEFTGYRPDGSTVTTSFTTDGIIDGSGMAADFETFYFDDRFADIVRFEVPSQRQALDNLVWFNVIPEPGPGQLLVLAAAILATARRLRRKSKVD